MMRILTIDPSSTVTGYAVIDAPDRLIDGGRIKPLKAGLPVEAILRSICDDLTAVIREQRPSLVVVELASTHWHMGQTAGGKVAPGMASNIVKYAQVAGGVCGFLLALSRSEEPGFVLAAIPADEWTGKRNKLARQQLIARQFPGYDCVDDPGAHVADAIDLALWWIAETRVRDARALQER